MKCVRELFCCVQWAVFGGEKNWNEIPLLVELNSHRDNHLILQSRKKFRAVITESWEKARNSAFVCHGSINSISLITYFGDIRTFSKKDSSQVEKVFPFLIFDVKSFRCENFRIWKFLLIKVSRFAQIPRSEIFLNRETSTWENEKKKFLLKFFSFILLARLKIESIEKFYERSRFIHRKTPESVFGECSCRSVKVGRWEFPKWLSNNFEWKKFLLASDFHEFW